MVTTLTDTSDVFSLLRSAGGDTLPYRQVFETLNTRLPLTEALIVSSLPRGGLQIVQPPRLPDGLMRAYTREMHAHDRLTWQAISRGQAVTARDVWSGQIENSAYMREMLAANGLAYAIAAPLSSPVLPGYPGAVHLYRNASQGPFSPDEIQLVSDFARDLDAAIVRIRQSRGSEEQSQQPMAHESAMRMFILDANLNAPFAQVDPSGLDSRLRESILQDARGRFEHVNGEDTTDRVSLPDSHGDYWNFRAVLHRHYPAFGDGPYVFFCVQPTCSDWSSLRPNDFAADAEITRLLPAMKFMREQFHRGPTLIEIAKTVHLSPFHFHRRFTELLGITPKHFLLDCQIEQAKSELLARQKDLIKIATECGFAHQSHFTSRFKQATGLTPTRWRRMAMEVSRSAQGN